MIDLIKTILLGIVEGVTEFLPISSTGHLIAAMALLQPFADLFPGDPAALNAYRDTFVIFIQLGAVVAIVAYYWREIWKQVTSVGSDRAVLRFWIAIVIAFIPAAVVGLALRGFIKSVLFSPVVVAISLIAGGVLILVMERTFGKRSSGGEIQEVSYRQATIVGVIQTISLIPGVSRAASSIFGGMFAGMNRETATRFSFYLAIPTLGAATVVDLLLSLDEVSIGDGLAYLLLGAVVAGIVAWVAVWGLLRYIARHDFTVFGWYRIIAGVVLLALIALAVVS